MDIDDELEAEIDIIYSGEYSDEISLFQYPLVPKENLNFCPISSIGINRENSSLKIEKNLDIRSLNQHFQKIQTTQTLNGERIEATTNLLMGFFRDNVFYMTPVANLYQFRYDFSQTQTLYDPEAQKKKVERRDIKPIGTHPTVKKENDEMVFTPLKYYPFNTIESCTRLDKMIQGDNKFQLKTEPIQFLSKEEYYALLLKYINDKSIVDELNELAIPPQNRKIMTEFDGNELKDIKKKSKIPFNMFINKEDNDKMDIDDCNAKVINIEDKEIIDKNINNVLLSSAQSFFGKNDYVNYDLLIDHLSQSLHIQKDNTTQIAKIKHDLLEICFVHNNKTCFLKNIGDDDEINKARIKLIEYLSQNKGVKKQQIKLFLSENNLAIQDNKLNKILKTIGDYANSLWILKGQ